jgi:hypothetical protein
MINQTRISFRSRRGWTESDFTETIRKQEEREDRRFYRERILNLLRNINRARLTEFEDQRAYEDLQEFLQRTPEIERKQKYFFYAKKVAMSAP